MDEEFVDAFQGASIADERWLYAVNGDGPPIVDDDSWLPHNLADLDEHPPVKPDLGDLGMVYPGKRHVFSGPQESAKTLAAYVIGLTIVRTGRKVVLIDFEMGPWDARTRLRELGATPDELAMIPYVEPEVKATPIAIRRLIALEPALVIIDAAAGAYQLQELDDNKRTDVEHFTAAYVREFWKNHVATIVLDHVVKREKGRGNYAIGSERKVGGADVHLGFEVIKPIKRGGRGFYKIVTHKDRGGFLKRGKLADFDLSSHPETNVIDWKFIHVETETVEHPWRPTHLMEKVSRHLEQQHAPTSRNKIFAELGGNRENLLKAVGFLVDDGFATEGDKGVKSERKYRESEHSQVVPGGTDTGTGTTGSVVPSPPGGTTPEPTDGTEGGSGTTDDDIMF